ncbi:hypothetical protein GCM10017687_54110 [Streptomyces echinatus]
MPPRRRDRHPSIRGLRAISYGNTFLVGAAQARRPKMLEEELATLAAAGGTAVVQAAGTDAWNGFRQAVA